MPFHFAYWFVCLFLSLTVAITGCTRADAAQRQSAHRTPSPVAPAPLPSKDTPWVRLVGKVAVGEDYLSKVSSPVQGRVVEVRAGLGQTVHEGDVLLVIDSPDLTAAYADYLKEVSELQYALMLR